MRPVAKNRLKSLAIAGIALAGCGDQPASTAPEGNITFNPRSSGALPTHQVSQQLLATEGPIRFNNIRHLFEQVGERCDKPLSATLEAGLDGTDQWLVECADTGQWELWLKPIGYDVVPASSYAVDELEP